MPKGSGVRFTILVEDRTLERFIRHCLLQLGAHPRELYVLPFPAGRGSGKQRIDLQYPREVQAYRRKRFENIALVVGTDADEQTVQQRAQRLADTLRATGCDERTDQDRIAIWIPKWNIETWLLFLKGEEVHEEVNYKNQAGEVSIKTVAAEFVRRFRQWLLDPDAAGLLPSLVSAFEETKRIQQAWDRAST